MNVESVCHRRTCKSGAYRGNEPSILNSICCLVIRRTVTDICLTEMPFTYIYKVLLRVDLTMLG
eukprot:m.34315 g.34315  ORF g.34315 m.34315 type:complete len:64 (-) comp12288_c0_seq1:56-247(-)